MFDINKYYQSVNMLKLSKKRIITNNYLSNIEKERLASNQDTQLVVLDNIVAILVNEGNFTRLYFDTTNLSSIACIIKYINNDVVIDLVGPAASIKAQSTELINCYFKIYTELTRWRTSKIIVYDDYETDSNFKYQLAEISMVQSIIDMLYSIFDTKVSHLPDCDKLQSLIADGLVFVAIDKLDNLCGIICFERVGSNGLYLYQICIDEKMRGKKLGVKLASYAYNHFKDCTNYTSWIENNNYGSQKLHECLGFVRDRLTDMVMLLPLREEK